MASRDELNVSQLDATPGELPPILNEQNSEDIDNVSYVGLNHIEKITYTFWKPIVIPIDLTVTIPTR